ncbi:MAG: hypothetical protein U1E65_00240 [Myxococcota bacterium]
MNAKQQAPKPRTPSGFDRMIDQSVTLLVEMLGTEQRDFELAAKILKDRLAETPGSPELAEQKAALLKRGLALKEGVRRLRSHVKPAKPARA